MEFIGAEVSQKIRSAIKAKLMELGAYVDEELPDYIMVMVVNKRTRAQMEGDLQLFLGDNTEEFTTWLHQVLQKLQEVTVASMERKRKSAAGDSEAPSNKKEKKKKTVDKKKDPVKQKSDSAAVTADNQTATEKQSPVNVEGSKKPVTATEKQGPVNVEGSRKPATVTATEKQGPVNVEGSKRPATVTATEKQGSVNVEGSKKPATATEKQGPVNVEGSKKPATAVSDVKRARRLSDDSLKEPSISTSKGKMQETKTTKPKQKIILMRSDEDDDDDDDDDDFINIKADAEAEALLDAELPKEVSEKNVVVNNTSTITITTKPDQPSERTVKTVIEEQKSLPMSTTSEKCVGDNVEDKAVSSSVSERSPLRRVTTVKDKEQTSIISRLGSRLGVRKNVSVAQVAPTRTVSITKALKLDEKRSDFISPLKRVDETDKTPRKRPLLSRVVAMHRDVPASEQKEEEEYDPTNPSVGSLASVVRVKPRPKIPAALQANKNLILKAVAEAHKSVANAPKRVDPTERPEGLFTKKFRDKKCQEISFALTNSKVKQRKEQQIHEKPLDLERIVIPVKLDASRPISSVNLQQKIVIQVSSKKPNEFTESPEPDSTNFIQMEAEELMDYEEETLKPLRNNMQIQEEIKEDDFNNLMDYEPESTWNKELNKDLETTTMTVSSRAHIDSPSSLQRSESPQFVVTLDGLDPRVFQATKKPLVTSTTQKETPKTEPKRSVSPIVFTPTSTTTSTETGASADSSKQKKLERCKYWPACRSGDKCDYLHPTSPCKSFPNCKFGDKCLYIHPNCKFDASCTRKDCPFTHAIPRNLRNSVSRAPPVLPASAKTTQICKYFPRCNNASCRYLHPKPCRYGRYCSRKMDCTFLHDEIPPAEKLKWFCPFRL